MNQNAEKLYKDFSVFLISKGITDLESFRNASPEEMNSLFKEFMDMQVGWQDEDTDEMDAYDYLDMADKAKKPDEKCLYARLALEMEPENLEAEIILANYGTHSELEKLRALEDTVDHGRSITDRMGLENGEYWRYVPARPYMQARKELMRQLIKMSMFHKALDIGLASLELNPQDNQGVRYDVMWLYLALEDDRNALKLYKQYREEDSQLILGLCMIAFRLDKLEDAKRWLNKLMHVNHEAENFILNYSKSKINNLLDMVRRNGDYQLGSQELAVALDEGAFAMNNLRIFIDWAKDEISRTF